MTTTTWHPSDVLAARLHTTFEDADGPLTVIRRTFPDSASKRVDATPDGWQGSWEELHAILGPAESATLSADGRWVGNNGWCECDPQPPPARCVRYEEWSADGRQEHGSVCPACRFIVEFVRVNDPDWAPEEPSIREADADWHRSRA